MPNVSMDDEKEIIMDPYFEDDLPYAAMVENQKLVEDSVRMSNVVEE